MQNKLTRKAYAKINLSLDVTGRRPNGYHDVKMIMQTIDLYDVLNFERLPGEAGKIALLAGEIDLGKTEDNLIYKAAKCLYERCEMPDGVRITLEKNIPVAAGMAGGSTDAAAALRGLNELFALGLSDRELCEIGVKLGADVPYCVMGGTYLAEGIGEILTLLPDAPDLILAIAKPQIGVSTKFVYEHLDERFADVTHPDVDAMRDALAGGDVDQICSLLGNVLEEVTIPAYPIVGQIQDVLRSEGAKGCLMSGSGPTVFAIFDSREKAQAAIDRVAGEGLANQVFVTGLHRR